MKRKFIVVAALALLAAVAAIYLWAPGFVPAGQKPLVRLTPANAVRFNAAFDAADRLPRVVLLFSPT